MEKEGKQGDMILVSGIRTGAAVVKVRIYEPFYKVKSLCYKLSFNGLAYGICRFWVLPMEYVGFGFFVFVLPFLGPLKAYGSSQG